jgi:hypothetical protein
MLHSSQIIIKTPEKHRELVCMLSSPGQRHSRCAGGEAGNSCCRAVTAVASGPSYQTGVGGCWMLLPLLPLLLLLLLLLLGLQLLLLQRG